MLEEQTGYPHPSDHGHAVSMDHGHAIFGLNKHIDNILVTHVFLKNCYWYFTVRHYLVIQYNMNSDSLNNRLVLEKKLI